ncbi:hypothetical protein [uncultured Pseudoxanthomonas sp.]|uniref:hypothetical protein n=1 Tax=uncultured Pseudoxanthomonas sp. TaxID=281701 RepID=UPI00262A5FF0|nr:hypothetical protein [uncultured Pseudoxanthomonas sp.]
MNDTDAIRRLMLAVERLEDAADKQARQMAEGLQHAHVANAELATAREAEEAKLRQAMVRLFQEQQQKTEVALRPVIGKAWRGLIGVAAGFALLYAGLLLLLRHEYQRLKDAQLRADAAEVSAEVRHASQHVEITSCGGRPCIAIDPESATWKSRGKEYILVDGRSGK